MGLFRSAMGLFRGKAGKGAEQGVAELLKEQVSTVTAQPEVARAEVQPEVARAEVKREARPDPNKPGWGLTIGQDISKAREDRASQE